MRKQLLKIKILALAIITLLGLSAASAAKITATSIVVTGGSLKMTTVATPTNTGNKPLCLNSNSLLALCSFNRSAADDLIEKQNGQIEAQQKQLQQQQIVIEGLRKIVCATNVTADVCRPRELSLAR